MKVTNLWPTQSQAVNQICAGENVDVLISGFAGRKLCYTAPVLKG